MGRFLGGVVVGAAVMFVAFRWALYEEAVALLRQAEDSNAVVVALARVLAQEQMQEEAQADKMPLL